MPEVLALLPAVGEDRGWRAARAQEFEASLGKIVRPCFNKQ